MDEIVFHHSPQTRSTGVLALLEELKAPYKLNLLNSRKGDLDTLEYKLINPMRKVPAIQHRGSVITEQPAVYTYLADLFPARGLAPGLNDPLRGEYLRWMSFYGSSFEPAVTDKMMKNPEPPFAVSPYGDYETTLETVLGHLDKFSQKGPYWLGEGFSALDVMWGSALGWIIGFGAVPNHPQFEKYMSVVSKRPSLVWATQKDIEFMKQFG